MATSLLTAPSSTSSAHQNLFHLPRGERFWRQTFYGLFFVFYFLLPLSFSIYFSSMFSFLFFVFLLSSLHYLFSFPSVAYQFLERVFQGVIKERDRLNKERAQRLKELVQQTGNGPNGSRSGPNRKRNGPNRVISNGTRKEPTRNWP
ncbi:hypothetical protein EI94DRAFT_915090 [Lactarius quietus]|nr:hypothetical protein EI94DRAFT_915090 [Lactarius quietus]